MATETFWLVVDRDDSDDVAAPGDTFEPHAGIVGDAVERGFDTLRKSWSDVLTQISELVTISDRKQQSSNLRLREINVGLTLTGEGKLAFIAKAGIEATVTVTFSQGVAADPEV